MRPSPAGFEATPMHMPRFSFSIFILIAIAPLFLVWFVCFATGVVGAGFLAAGVLRDTTDADGRAPVDLSRESSQTVTFRPWIPGRYFLYLETVDPSARDGAPASGRFPAIVERTPYSKSGVAASVVDYYVSRGYAVVIQDVRGRYESDGEFLWQAVTDKLDGDADWSEEGICSSPAVDGKVSERKFYSRMALFLVLVVLLGFAPSFYLRGIVPPYPRPNPTLREDEQRALRNSCFSPHADLMINTTVRVCDHFVCSHTHGHQFR